MLPIEDALRLVDGDLARIARFRERWHSPADELHQVARIAFVRAYPKYHGNSSLRNFASVVARNACIQYMKFQTLRVFEGTLADCSLMSDSRFENAADAAIAVESLIPLLPPKRQETVRLRMQEYTWEEIAARVGYANKGAAIKSFQIAVAAMQRHVRQEGV